MLIRNHKLHLIAAFAGISIITFSCKDDTENPGVITDPVETNDPNTNYQPAFEGQTRANGLKTTTTYNPRIITSSLDAPWGVVSLPDGRLLVTEKAGTMRIVTQAGQVSAPVTGIPQVNSAGQGGLLGLCLDPDFSGNRMVYWVFSELGAGGNVTALAKGRLSSDDSRIENATVIYRATPGYVGTLHYGGRVLFDRSGHLILSTGERSDLITRPQAQDLNSGLGKIIRLTKDGNAAPGNPFTSQSEARPELYSYGHRNPQGLAIHPVTGDLWSGEHGPRGGDEINRIEAGKNYGWPVITYGIEYSGAVIGDGIQQKDGMEQPVYYWDPVVSPSGMTFYSGNKIPEWRNNLFIGALSGMHIARLAFDGNKVIGEERLLAGERQRFRDISQGTDGALYAVTDQGRLYRISND
ncbi:MAG: PQQ-dependent sugar dehydrogenase [Chitinophagaceae bacterium]